ALTILTLYNTATQNIAVTDDNSHAQTATVAVTPTAATAASLTLAAVSTTPIAGASDNLTITAKDAYGNQNASGANDYDGDKSLTFTGANDPALTSNHPKVTNKTGTAIVFGNATTITFAHGQATVSSGNNGALTLYKAEAASLVVSD